MVILIFGDSITQGYWDEEGGWADRLKRDVMHNDIKRGYRDYHGVFNLGIDSNFTKDVLARIDNEIEARRFPGADANSDYAIMFAIGVNDSLHSGDSYVSEPERYARELRELGDKAKQLTSRIAFVNLLPIDESAKDQAAGDDGRFYTNDRINDFNEVLEEFCRSDDFALVDARHRFINNYSLFSPDGTHPNADGHKAIYSEVQAVIKSWLGSSALDA